MKMKSFAEYLEILNSNGSRLFKEAKLKEFGDENPTFVKLLKRAYSPEYVYGIKKVPGVENFGTLELSEHWTFVEQILDRLCSRAVTGNEAREEVASLLSILEEKEARVLENLLKGDLRCGVNVSIINKVFPGTIPEYPYMRCSLREGSNIGKFDWGYGVISQEKADGMYASIAVSPTGEIRITSRNGTLFANTEFSEFIEDFKAVADKGVCYNGELLVTENGVIQPREIGNGILNSVLKGGCFQKNQKPYYKIWDIIPQDYHVAGGKYMVPYESRLKLIEGMKGAFVSVIDTKIIHSLEEAMEHYVEVTSKGKEGTVVKNPKAIWKDGTSKDQIKFKIEAEVDLIVRGYNPGNGKNTKWFGSLVCESSDGLVQTNVSGFTDKERERIFNEIDSWIDKKIITVKANSLMPNTSGGPRRLFLPAFVEERLDKTEADTLGKIENIFKEAMGK